jgi:hypothetical protein
MHVKRRHRWLLYNFNYINITYYKIIKFNFVQPQHPMSALNQSSTFEIHVPNRGHRFLQPPRRQEVHFPSRSPGVASRVSLSISLSPTRRVQPFSSPTRRILLTFFAVLFAPCGRRPYLCFQETEYLYTYKHSLLWIYTYIHYSMSTFERLSQLDIKIHEVSHQERLTVDENVVFHRKNLGFEAK